MILTREILEKNGFINNHPERVLGKYHYIDPKGLYKITAEQTYTSKSNKLGWNMTAWHAENNEFAHKSSANNVENVEDLQAVIDLSRIDLLIYAN